MEARAPRSNRGHWTYTNTEYDEGIESIRSFCLAIQQQISEFKRCI